ncbi:MAG: hypothetical protein C5B54_08705 [Acidobacteria bacterium]|nr:MAG: hypothetical protein C5B54_08705 [Acidobacteriota bacterium]
MARYYNPQIGRFVGEDQMLDAILMLYTYTNNDPIQLVDPAGEAAQAPSFSWPPPGLQGIPDFPSPKPDRASCCKDKIFQRFIDVFHLQQRFNLDHQKQIPAGGVLSRTKPVADTPLRVICNNPQDPDDCYLVPRKITTFTDMGDKCVNYCVKVHEWQHRWDRRHFNLQWGNGIRRRFFEYPIYSKEMDCLISFF